MFTPTEREILGQAIHEQYCATWLALREAGDGQAPSTSDMALRQWSELSEMQRESSRAQADRIPEKLLAMGFAVVPLKTPGARRLVLQSTSASSEEPIVVLPDDAIEELARQEHNEWMRHKLLQEVEHPLAIDYDELTPAQQRLDSDPVRNLPHLLMLVGMGVLC